MKYLSIIVPNHHTPSVDKAIYALENQDYDKDRYEIIVVGMDRYRIVQESNQTHLYLSEKPLSPAQARNYGAQYANGELLAFIDADCIPANNWLSIIAERFIDPSISVLGGGVNIDNRNYWTLADNLSMFYEYLASQPPGERLILPSLNLIIRRRVFEEVRGFDERYPRASGEDADLSIRLRQLGYRLEFEPRAVVHHNPPRNRFVDIIRHGYYQGMYSTKVDPRYINESSLPLLIRSRLVLIIFSPILAIGALFRMIKISEEVRTNWHTIPAIFMEKMAWCFGAASHHKNLTGGR